MAGPCPQCSSALSFSDQGLAHWSCAACGGAWIPGDVFGRTLRLYPLAPTLAALLSSAKTSHSSAIGLSCPVCRTRAFKTLHRRAVTLNLCTSCGGAYFEQGELQKAFALQPTDRKGAATAIAADAITNALFVMFS